MKTQKNAEKHPKDLVVVEEEVKGGQDVDAGTHTGLMSFVSV
jgi:hypothetical protein